MGMPPFLTSPIALRLLQTFQRLLLAVIYQRFLNDTSQGKAGCAYTSDTPAHTPPLPSPQMPSPMLPCFWTAMSAHSVAVWYRSCKQLLPVATSSAILLFLWW